MNAAPLDLGLVLASVAAILGVMAAVRRVGARRGWSAELQRKCVHLATGLYALCLPFLFTEDWPVMLLVAVSLVAMLVLRLPRLAAGGIGGAIHGVGRASHGEMFMAASVGLLFVLSAAEPVLYVLPLAVLTLSDAAAALTGTRYGRKHFRVEEGAKSWEGVTMFFLVTLILSMVLLLLLSGIDRERVVLLSFLVAAFGTLVEADSWRGLDNLFIPVGLNLVLAANWETPPLQLAALAVVFVAALAGTMALAPALRLTRHAARSYAVLVFLVCATTDAHNAILPVLAVCAHLAARSLRPCRSAYPDLDLLAVAAGVALLWLFVGEYLGTNALDAYNLTFAGAALVFVGLAAGPRRHLALFALPVAAGLTLLVAEWNAARVQSGGGALWPWVLASLGLCAAAAASRPDLFDRHRASRAVAAAMPVPVALFAMRVLHP